MLPPLPHRRPSQALGPWCSGAAGLLRNFQCPLPQVLVPPLPPELPSNAPFALSLRGWTLGEFWFLFFLVSQRE